jgi:tripartite-type tricarboxylate transporter receptor subunit TctC
MKLPRRRFLHLAAGAAALLAITRIASGQGYPTRPVRLIVGFTPGGPTDIAARLIATEAVVNSQPALLMVSTSAAVSATFYHNLNFNLIRDIAPVAGVVRVPLVMVVNPSVPTQTVPEFIAYAKANPGKINMASVGNGTTPHMAGELFKMMAGVDMLHVPYRGAAPALTDLLGGRAQVMFEGMLSLTEHIRTGRLRALAVTPVTRSPLLPDVGQTQRGD